MNRKTMTILSLIGLSTYALGQDIAAAPATDLAAQPDVLATTFAPVVAEDEDAELNFGNEEGEFNNEEGVITEEIDIIPEPVVLPAPEILVAQPTMRLLQEAAALGLPDLLLVPVADEDQQDNEEAGLEGEFNNEEGVITEEIDIVPGPVPTAQPAVLAQPAMRLLEETVALGLPDVVIVPVAEEDENDNEEAGLESEFNNEEGVLTEEIDIVPEPVPVAVAQPAAMRLLEETVALGLPDVVIVPVAEEAENDNEEAGLESEFNNEEGVITEEIDIVPEPVVVAPAARLLQEVASELPSIAVIPVVVAEPADDAAVETEWGNGETEFGNEETEIAGEDLDILADIPVTTN